MSPGDMHPPRPWRDEMRCAVTDVRELCDLLDLSADALAAQLAQHSDFPLRVPHSLIRRMRRGDPNDPLLRQVIALDAENQVTPGYGTDPLQERSVSAGGVLQKYAGRALLITTAACPLHCRYCFRRHFPYSQQHAARDHWSTALDTLRNCPSISEVILSGGDPLSLSTQKLTELFAALSEIDSITTVRIHTRFPIAIPARVTPALLNMLEGFRGRLVIVVHSNHANEIDDREVRAALTQLKPVCDALLNQSVLLHNVNDSEAALSELSHALFDAGVLPYYLHLLDRVAGAAHFAVDENFALTLMGRLRDSLPGYLVPKLVREEPGALSKTPQI